MKRIRLVWSLTAFVACAHAVPDPPAPLALDAHPGLAPETGAWPSWPAAIVIAPWLRPPPGPPLPLPEVPVELDPPRPLQASALVVRVRQPAGPRVEAPSLRVAGRAVHLTETETGWGGVAGLPLDSAGFHTVELAYRRAGRSETRAFVVPVAPRVYPSARIRISAGGTTDPEVEARIAREGALIDAALQVSGPAWLPREPFAWPRPAVKTSVFGQRRVFNGGVSTRHLGLDLRGRRGEPVRAPAAGQVVLTGSFYFQGNAVYIDHGLGLVTAYFHFSETDVTPGDMVEAGQIIGRVGSSGRSTGPHLHWSAYVRGDNVDPESLVGLTLVPGIASGGASVSPGR